MKSILVITLAGLISSAYAQQFTIYNTSNSGMPDNTVRALLHAADGSLWIGTDYGLAHFKDYNWTVYQSVNSQLPDDDYVRSIAEDKDGKIWAGTFLGGLAIFGGDSVEAVFNTSNSPLPDNQVRSIAFDSAGAWLGTTGGLVYKRDTAWQVYNINNSILKSNNIAAIFIDDFHRVWIGTVNGGLVMIDDTTWTLYRNNNSGLPDNTVLSIAGDSENNIWIASPAGGVITYSGSNWEVFNTVNSNAATNSYNGITILNDTKYLSAIASGLVIYRGGTDWENFTAQNSALPQDDLLCAEAGDSNCIWVGTLSSGLVKFCEQDSVDFISPAEEVQISIYPLPVSTQLNIHFSANAAFTEVNIFDISGKKIFSETLYDSTLIIPVESLPEGIYFLEIIGGKQRKIVKVMKQ